MNKQVDTKITERHEITGDAVEGDGPVSANQRPAAHSETPNDSQNLGVNTGPGGGRSGSNPTNPTPTTDPSTVEKEGVDNSDSSQSQGKPAPADSDDG